MSVINVAKWFLVIACAAAVGALIGRILLPNNGPCTLDWGIIGVWVQDAFVLGGVLVAAYQLMRFNDNERVKNTLRLYEQFMQSPVQTSSGKELTAFSAGRYLAEGAREAATYVAIRKKCEGGNATANETVWINEVLAGANTTHNFFDTVAVLFRRGLLDRAVFFDTLAGLTVTRYEQLEKLLDVDPKLLRGSPLFKELAEQARAYLKEHPDRMLDPSSG
jgi:hypothetical protein